MPFIELHVHTKAGSADSSISVDALGKHASEQGTGAILVAEHWRVWTEWEQSGFEAQWGVKLFAALEQTTDEGHFIVIGPQSGETLPSTASKLLEYTKNNQYFVIWAHPFRHFFDAIGASRPPFAMDATLEELAAHPTFSLVDAIEIENAGCTERENSLALEVSQLLTKPVTVGSDAHDVEHIGARRLPIPEIPQNTTELIELIQSLSLENMPNLGQ
jgi:predicted metal-dependent phosphoesterase TrpH